MKRSAITGIRLKDEVYQQLLDYHQQNYPDTPFVVSQIILELLQKGLGNNVKQVVKQDVKQDDKYITRQEFDAFKENISQQVNELNNLLNSMLNTNKNETSQGVESTNENEVEFEAVMQPEDSKTDDEGDRPENENEKNYAAAIAIAKEKIISGENLESIEKFLSENGYHGKQGKPIKWATRLSKIPAIKTLREKL